jgi:hypothetical protein
MAKQTDQTNPLNILGPGKHPAADNISGEQSADKAVANNAPAEEPCDPPLDLHTDDPEAGALTSADPCQLPVTMTITAHGASALDRLLEETISSEIDILRTSIGGGRGVGNVDLQQLLHQWVTLGLQFRQFHYYSSQPAQVLPAHITSLD